MLESLGYEEAEARDDANLILFNTCSIRESADSRFIGNLGEAKRLKTEDPDRIVGVGGCWAQSVKDEVFERFPFVDVAFGPGQIHKLAEFLTSESLTAQGYFEFEDFAGRLPMKREREFQAWVQIIQGCNQRCAFCIVPSTRGHEVSREPDELVAEIEQARPRRRTRGHAARPERQLVRPRPAEGGTRQLRRAPGASGCDRRHRTHPLHQSPSHLHARGRPSRPCRAPDRVRAHPSTAPIGRDANPEGDEASVYEGALPRPCGDDPRARAGRRADHRHHRGLPGRDRRRLPGDPRGRRASSLRLGVHVHLLAPPRDGRR